MSSCLDNIVTLGLDCDETSLSGYKLLQAAGMSYKNLENIAAEQYGNGVTLANAKKELALITFQNDFIGVLQGNRIATEITSPIYDSVIFKPAIDMGASAVARGVTIHAAGQSYRGQLRKRKIKSIQCYPLDSGSGEILIVDLVDGIWQEIPTSVNFVANAVNTFTIEYTAVCPTFRVLINAPDISFCSAFITCKKGCNGSMPNPCAWVDGWDGEKAVKEEGYGINVKFSCECDYTQLICDLAKTMTGELIWLKWQELIWQEQYETNRFNSWSIYNREDLAKVIIPNIQAQYNAKWNAMIGGGLINILKTYKDSCLDCRGVRVVTNV